MVRGKSSLRQNRPLNELSIFKGRWARIAYVGCHANELRSNDKAARTFDNLRHPIETIVRRPAHDRGFEDEMVIDFDLFLASEVETEGAMIHQPYDRVLAGMVVGFPVTNLDISTVRAVTHSQPQFADLIFPTM